MKRTKAIGIFDSGFGGLSILKDIVKALPQYRYVYLGDTARAPYGSRSSKTIYGFSKQAVDFLFKKECDLIIFACNTASAEALRKIQQQYLPKKYSGKRVLGVIVPTLEAVAEMKGVRRIGVLGTEATVHSNTFPTELKKFAPTLKMFQQAAPLLVPMVESGQHASEAARLIVEGYLRPLLKKNLQAIVLGCTHYGHVGKLIQAIAGDKVRVVSEGPIVAKKLKEYLVRHPEIEKKLSRRGGRVFYSTGSGKRFNKLGRVFFGTRVVSRKGVMK
jgi:glutamate racemase